jgi:hypothetical protein
MNYYAEAGKCVDVPIPTMDEFLKCNTKGASIKAKDIIIHSYKLNYGRKKNPIYDVTFYKGNNIQNMVTTKIRDSVFYPKEAEERILQIFCKNLKIKKTVSEMLDVWQSAHTSLGKL